MENASCLKKILLFIENASYTLKLFLIHINHILILEIVSYLSQFRVIYYDFPRMVP